MGLTEYQRKRDFSKTPEPAARRGAGRRGRALSFVVQKHDASRLHYDFRLEMEGVLRSWAVPKGPSLKPSEKRLAVHVEDHPLSYGTFEGVIPEGQYGGGTVLLWDRGRWIPEGDPVAAYRAGKLKFRLEGEKLSGGWTLVRMGGPAGEGGKNWLLIKERDEAALTGRGRDVTELRPESVDSGRGLDDIAAEPDRVRVEGARRGRLPADPRPQLATLRAEVPDGDDWIHELKYDGYRLLVRVAKGSARVLTRSGKDWTARFPHLARAAAALPVEAALLDGEAVVLLKGGASSFQALQEALGNGAKSAADVVFYAFDLLHLDGWDLTRAPLLERKRALAALVPPGVAGPIRLSDHVQGSGPEFHERACRLGLEGIVAKRARAPYRPGRGDDWLKIKCQQRQELVVGGWSEPKGSRSGIGALLVGYHQDGELRFAGKVGTGFSDAALAALHARLVPLERKSPPFANPPRGAAARGVHWVRPELVVEVEFTEWTRDGHLRHPSYKGAREDKPAADVVRERAQEEPHMVARPAAKAATLPGRLTSPDKVLWPGQGITKLALARYYERVAPWILPHVERRPLSLVRCPRGAGQPCFYQKHPGDQLPDAVGRVDIEEKDGTGEYVYVESVEGLIALVQVGTLEIHGWGSRIDALERPDQMIFDLDPDAAVPWERVVAAARGLRERLTGLGLASWVKTTGGKGLHVVVPLSRRQGFDEVREFSQRVAERMVEDEPARFVATMSKAKRKGKIFVDYLRNARGATAIAPYSTRARAGAPVAVPIGWDELARVKPASLTVETVPRRLDRLKTDPWAGFAEARQSLTKKAWAALERG